LLALADVFDDRDEMQPFACGPRATDVLRRTQIMLPSLRISRFRRLSFGPALDQVPSAASVSAMSGW
jgi:hypothetical protein